MSLEKPIESTYISNEAIPMAGQNEVFQGELLKGDEEKGNKALKALESLQIAFNKKKKN